MMQAAYPYKLIRPRRYIFVSTGRRRIEKIVDFVPLGNSQFINMGFGDLLADGSIDDKANSNNGDIVKVMSTVIEILKHYTTQNPDVEIYFEGSTLERTKLYDRILKTYYVIFRKDFNLGCVVEVNNDFQIVPYEPSSYPTYIGFIIKRIL